MTPFPLFFVLLDLPSALCDRVSFDQDGRGKENTANGLFTLRTVRQGRFGHPLDGFKARPAMVTTFFRINRPVFISWHIIPVTPTRTSVASRTDLPRQGGGELSIFN